MNLNNRQIQSAMKRMGIAQVDIPAKRVIIETDDKQIIVTEPQVLKVNMMGQQTFQISGNITEKEISSTPEINEEDISTVIEQTGASRQDVMNAIEEAKGDLAKAILELKNI